MAAGGSGSDPREAAGFRRRVAAARTFASVERAWLALWPAAAVLGVFAAASLFGLWLAGLPLAVHLALLALFVSAFGLALYRARGGLRLASRDAGLARLERDSGAAHQPLRTLDDTLPDGVQDPVTRRLWGLHRERLLAGLARLRVSPPRSLLPARDPWALRAALLLVLVVALVHARGEVGPRLLSAFTPARASAVAEAPPRLDLWITPPAYTRRPPLGAEQTRGQASLTVPAGSVALVQLHHQTPGGAALAPRAAYGEAEVPFTDLGAGSAEARVELGSDGHLTIRDGRGGELASWFVRVAPDAPPTVAFAETPRATHRGVLRIGYKAGDDYGVAELAMLLAPLGREEEAERIGLAKPAAQPQRLESGSFADLTAHPLAGLKVMLTLEAVDGLGQKGRSEPLEVVLPAREFRHPMARAIIEQRRQLAGDPATAPDVAGRLAALAETEAAQSLPTTVPLSLRVAAARLSFNREPDSRRGVIDLLWELALFVEDGALSLAERKLRELQEQLQKALEEGGEDAEIERMMEEMQKALDEYLEELARQAMADAQRANPEQQQLPPDAQTVERRDLQQMLDRARELMRSGAKDAAREMLAQLQQMLENLRAGTMQAQQQPSPGERAVSDLQKMIQLQQQLLDKSFQMERQRRSGETPQQGRQGQQGQQGQRRQPGQQQRGGQPQPGGEPDPNGDPMGQAAAEQDALRKALGELMRRLGEAGMEIPRALGQAELQMRNARGALEGEEPGTAAEAQTSAVDSMQRAGQAMMEQLREQMAQQQGQQPGEGPGGEPMQAGRRGRDPLGRSTRNDGGFDTRGVEIPAEGGLGRARDVLEELYRRAGDQRRPPAELDYYKRLLDRF